MSAYALKIPLEIFKRCKSCYRILLHSASAGNIYHGPSVMITCYMSPTELRQETFDKKLN